MGCDHNCASCRGCMGVLELTDGEVEMLRTLGQFAFLPIARKADDMVPVYLEDENHSPEEYSLILQCLEQKNLISIDYDKPMGNVDMSAYGGYPVHGSMALTARGQEVLDTLAPREKKVLELRFGIVDGRTRTLEEVGKEFNVTRERIRQIEAKALRKLRHPSRSKKLKDFLN